MWCGFRPAITFTCRQIAALKASDSQMWPVSVVSYEPMSGAIPAGSECTA
jgi:hypothetical protein